jgi:2-polyprenyl-3-methyl-5-hydroxy-6-metoxy-1,4-benzoquinol methylase
MKKNINLKVRKLLISKKFYVKNNSNKINLFEENYHGTIKDPDGKIRNLITEKKYKISQLKFIIKFLKNYKPGKILDVGCGHGWLLSVLNKKWKKFGIDISELASKNASIYGKIYTGNLKNYKEKDFDVITALHLIEHLNKPEEFIIKINKILKKKGILILETPDFDSAAARRYGNKFRLLHDKTHVSLFSQDSLIRFVRNYGFDVFDINYPYFETPYFTKKNLLRILDNKTTSPPFYGSVITLFLKKK